MGASSTHNRGYPIFVPGYQNANRTPDVGESRPWGLSIWIAVTLTWLLMIPSEAYASFSDLVIFPYRLFLIFCIPWLFREIANGNMKLGYVDILTGAMLYWILFSLTISEGIGKALSNGGASVVDIGAAYFIGRCCVNSFDKSDRYLRAMAPAYLVGGITVLIETVSGHYIFRPLLAKILSVPLQGLIFTSTTLRFGLVRGTGLFPHPILGGIQLAGLLPLFVLCAMPFRARIVGIFASILAIATVSSSALLFFVIAAALIVYEFVGKIVVDLTWSRLIWGIAIILFVLQIFTKGGLVGVTVNFLTFDKDTAYYRVLIWHFGSMTVASHPWVGIGFGSWERPVWMTPSIDNYWLYIAMNYGLPEALMRFIVPISAVFIASRASNGAKLHERRIILGYSITVAVTTVMGFTVSYWGVTQSWYFFLIGALVSLPRALSGQGDQGASLPRPNGKVAVPAPA